MLKSHLARMFALVAVLGLATPALVACEDDPEVGEEVGDVMEEGGEAVEEGGEEAADVAD